MSWCADRGLVEVDADLLEQMYGSSKVVYPPLEGQLSRARVSMLGHLGDFAAAQRQRRALLRVSGQRLSAARSLWEAAITEADRPVRALLWSARALPAVGVLRDVRDRAERKRLTALHREARHPVVLRGTARLDGNSISTMLILRAAALRLLGSLDEAAELADEALARARREEHAVRTAHAAFQKAMALTWAHRTTEARRCLNDELRPYASLAANRWVAWSHFIEGALEVRDRSAPAALSAFDLSAALFAAEALMDGAVSARLGRLAALRLAGDLHGWRWEAERIGRATGDDGRDWRWYAERSDVTAIALGLERGEFARTHEHDLSMARSAFSAAAAGPYPLFVALGRLGLAMSSEGPESEAQARRASSLGSSIGARLVVSRAQELLDGAPDARGELFFC